MQLKKMNEVQVSKLREIIGNSVLISVGINHYKNKEDNLKNCIKDAQDVYRIFSNKDELQLNHEKSAKMCSSEQSQITKESILKCVEEKAMLATKNEKIIFYYSGHGVVIEEKFFIIPSNGDISKIDSLVSLDELLQIISRCPAKSKILIFDACRTVKKGTKCVEKLSFNFLKRYMNDAKGVAILYSCNVNEYSMDQYLDKGNSVFTRFLIEGLMGHEDALNEHYLTITSLYKYVSVQSKQASMRFSQIQQTPTISLDVANDVILGLYNPEVSKKDSRDNSCIVEIMQEKLIFDKLGNKLTCLLNEDQWYNTQLLVNELINNVFENNEDVMCTLEISSNGLILKDTGIKFNPLTDLRTAFEVGEDHNYASQTMIEYRKQYKDVELEYEYIDDKNVIKLCFAREAFNIDELCVIDIDTCDYFAFRSEENARTVEFDCKYYYYIVPKHSPCRSLERNILDKILASIPIASKLIVVDNTLDGGLIGRVYYSTNPRIIYSN